MVLLEIELEAARQLEPVDGVVRLESITDGRPGLVLEGEGRGPVDGPAQQRLEEHARGRVLVMIQQKGNARGPVDPWVVAVETEQVICFLDPCMETPAVPSETHTENIFILGRITKKETSLRLVLQFILSLVSIHLSPVVWGGDDAREAGNQEVDKINLSVWLPLLQFMLVNLDWVLALFLLHHIHRLGELHA